MPVINKSDHWDDEFERLNPEMTVKRIHSLNELKDIGFDVKYVSPNIVNKQELVSPVALPNIHIIPS